MARGDLQLRDLRIIFALANARSWVTTRELAQRFGLEQRTVQRIIKAMEEIPLPMERDEVGGGVRLARDFEVHVSLPANLVELAALQIARDKMRIAADGSVVGDAFEMLSERAMKTVKGVQRAIVERFVRMYRGASVDHPSISSPIGEVIHRGMDTSTVVLLEYTSQNQQRAQRRKIEPIAVWTASLRSYVLAFDRERGAERTFALDRIRTASLASEHFAPRPDFDVVAYFGQGIEAFVGGESVELQLSLDPEPTRRLGNKVPPRARLIRRPDGGAMLHWAIPLSDELLAWIVGLGAGVSVVSPQKAIAYVADELRRRADGQYKDKPKRKRPQSKRPQRAPGHFARGPAKPA